MIIFKNNDVYDVCTWSRVKSYTESTVDTPSRIPDTFCRLWTGISKLFLWRPVSKYVVLRKPRSLHHNPYLCHCSRKQPLRVNTEVDVAVCQAAFCVDPDIWISYNYQETRNCPLWLFKIHFKIQKPFQLMDHTKQVAGQMWLMDHGLLTPGLEDV